MNSFYTLYSSCIGVQSRPLRHGFYCAGSGEPLPCNGAAGHVLAIRGQALHEHVPHPHLYLRVFFRRLYLRIQVPCPDFLGTVHNQPAAVHLH